MEIVNPDMHFCQTNAHQENRDNGFEFTRCAVSVH